jgi:glutamine cyclotransferase
MSLTKFFVFSGITLLFLACGGETNPARLFSIEIEGNKSEFKKNQVIGLSVKSKKDIVPDKVTYSIDGNILPQENDKITLKVDRLGKKELKAVVEYGDSSAELSKNIRVLSETPPRLYTYEIIGEFPHDMEAFTQGLEFYNGFLYEGTGQKGKSSLKRIKWETGEALVSVDLDYNYFGEGITVMDDKIYQLTWKSKTGFVYDAETLERLESFQYGKSQEGWGLCNDGAKIYKSDGTEKIWILDPQSLVEEDYIQIVTNKSLFNKANELEFVEGKIYANVWQKESMMIINAQSGAIEGVVNLGGLKQKVKQHQNLDVLNGIAYHPQRKTFFVTGKNWDKIFEIRIIEK